jgi:hypothetical protein
VQEALTSGGRDMPPGPAYWAYNPPRLMSF